MERIGATKGVRRDATRGTRREELARSRLRGGERCTRASTGRTQTVLTMGRVVYGVFDSAESADEAISDLTVPQGEFNAVIHEQHVREEDVQLGGTDAMRGAIAGGVIVGVFGFLAAVLLIWPSHGWHDAWAAGLLMGFAGSVFGIVAGGVAGASECKASIREGAEFAKKRGKWIVTCELDHNRDAATVIEAFREHGGEHVDAA